VTLPHAWERTRPGFTGTLRYDIVLPPGSSPQDRALLIARVGNVYRILLDGVVLADSRRPGSLADHGQAPVYLPLPHARAPAQDERLSIEVTGQAGREPGLSALWIGPVQDIYARYDREVGVRVRSSWTLIAASLVTGGLALLMALRLRQWHHWAFALACFLWAWRLAMLQLPQWGPWAPAVQWLFQASYVWFVVLAALYALHLIGPQPGVDAHRERRVLAGYAAVASVVVAIGLGMALPAARTGVLLSMVVVGAWCLLRVALSLRRQPTAVGWLLLASAVVACALGARDVWVFRIAQDYGPTTWTRFAVLMLMAVLAWELVDAFARTSQQLKHANDDLRERVTARERELEAVYERTRERDRRQAALEERDRILRDMHDGVGGRLVAAMALTQQPEASGAPLTTLHELRQSLDECLTELRLSLDSLEPGDHPVAHALGELRRRMEPALRAAGVQLVWDVEPSLDGIVLSAPHTLHLVRIAREALSNIAKHAVGATQATLGAQCVDAETGRRLHLVVSDNGRVVSRPGAAPAGNTPKVTGGRGLANIQRRATALGAQLDVGARLGGWWVEVVVPLPATGRGAAA
jgi:signal transduction histidine kinase